jgi:tetratricopeptide (TPR) repeat protein
MCQAQCKQWDNACSQLGTASQLDPENKRYLNMLGFCLARAGRFDDSYDCFAREMGEAKAHYNVARMLHHVKRDPEAKKHVELALAANPDYAEARKLLADLESGNGTSKDVVPVLTLEAADGTH